MQDTILRILSFFIPLILLLKKKHLPFTDPINSLLRLSCYILLVNGEIQDFQQKLQDLAEELKSLQGLVVLKNQHLAEKELDLRWFGIRGVVSSKKRQELSATAEHLCQKKVIY